MSARRITARLTMLVSATALALAMFGAGAQAAVEYQDSFGEFGEGAGQFKFPNGLGVNDASGHVYVADRDNNRIVALTEAGEFELAWGYDVVASGTSNEEFVDEVQSIFVPAGSGSFQLTFSGESTGLLDHDSSAAEVEAALNGLATINSDGGAVSVSGGPGSESGDEPYEVTFGGSLEKTSVEEITIDGTPLGAPLGTVLTCDVADPAIPTAAPDELSYQWLADGDPISGATDEMFAVSSAQAGMAIQCEATGRWGEASATRANPVFTVAHPAPVDPIPLGPANSPQLNASEALEVGGAGGQSLTCNAGGWSHEPTSYTYRWYRDGEPLGAPETTAATSVEHTVTANDLDQARVFQCTVEGANASGSSLLWSNFIETTPAVENRLEDPAMTVLSSNGPRVVQTTQGGPVLEVCLPTDTCKAGVGGAGVGQLAEPITVAVDNSAGGGGAVYVAERNSHRVQKFTAAGEPLLMIGTGVNKTTGANTCVIASGDVCGAGRASRIQPGGFGQWSTPFECCFAPVQEIDVDDAGYVYVGDVTLEGVRFEYGRIEKFDSDGDFVGQIKLPGYAPGTGFFTQPISVGVDSLGRIFTATSEVQEILRLDQSELSLEYTGPLFAARNYFGNGLQPTGLAIDPVLDYIWNIDLNGALGGALPIYNCGESGAVRNAIMAWDAEGHQLECDAPSGAGTLTGFRKSNGIAVSDEGLMFVSTGETGHQIKVFKLPRPSEPEVVSRSVRAITQQTAKIRAQLKPGFLASDVMFEYGTEPCASGGCVEIDGGKVHGLKAQQAEVTLDGLDSDTRYFYRVTITNAEGQDVSTEGSFTTFRFIDLNDDKCENVLARKQTGAAPLLDCRAYELASAAFSGGYDVASDLSGENPLAGTPEAPGKLLYTVVHGGIPGTGSPTNRGRDPYVAVRGEQGWTTRYVGVPSDSGYSTKRFASDLIGADADLDTFAFGGPDICSPCFPDQSTGIPVRLPDGSLVQGMQGSIPQAGAESESYVGRSLSADGRYIVFGTTSQLVPEGNDNGDPTLYRRDLTTGLTEVVSTTTSGQTVSGAELGALDLSDDGSRVLFGTLLGTDERGNSYWHPYMRLGSTPASIDLAPGASAGVLFNGMTADGSRVFFTTVDQLDPGDSDESADIYEAVVGDGGPVDLRLVSVGDGGPSNADGCTPAGLPNTWNAPVGDGKCSAITFAGGAGLAADNGTFYFLSPELLDGSSGIQDQANLYVVEPGGDPEFIATIDTSEGKPGPGHWTNELSDPDFTDSALDAPESVAVDSDTGDVYVMEDGKSVARFDESGAPKTFTATGTNELTGFNYGSGQPTQVAFDNSGALYDGTILATQFQGKIRAFDRDGEQVGELTGAGNPVFGAMVNPCGVAVDQSNGDIYVADNIGPEAGLVWRYELKGTATPPLDQSDYVASMGVIFGTAICQLAADNGFVYAGGYPEGPTRALRGEDFGFGPQLPIISGPAVDEGGHAVAVDPVADDLYVGRGNRILVYRTGDFAKVNEITEGGLVESRGVAVNPVSRTVYASNGSHLQEYAEVPPPYHPLGNPAILHAELSAEHHYGDFQVTPDGRFAAFTSTMPLASGFDNAGHSEVYRFDTDSSLLECASCSPTEAVPSTDATLPGHGLGLTDDGRLFFNTGEQLVLRDTNENLDAYEWKKDETTATTRQALISTGSSHFDSEMLGVTADGTDAFFFTRETVVESEDLNGEAMKIYDARENGGFFKLPEPTPCAAADECRGAGTQASPPPQIGSFKGVGGQYRARPAHCRKGFVKRKGKCVRKKRGHCAKNRKKAGKQDGRARKAAQCKRGKKGKRGKRTGSGRKGANR